MPTDATVRLWDPGRCREKAIDAGTPKVHAVRFGPLWK